MEPGILIRDEKDIVQLETDRTSLVPEECQISRKDRNLSSKSATTTALTSRKHHKNTAGPDHVYFYPTSFGLLIVKKRRPSKTIKPHDPDRGRGLLWCVFTIAEDAFKKNAHKRTLTADAQ